MENTHAEGSIPGTAPTSDFAELRAREFGYLLPAITVSRPGAPSNDTSSSTRPVPRTSWTIRRARTRRPSTGPAGPFSTTGGLRCVGVGMEAACRGAPG